MWVQEEDSTAADSDGEESGLSSEDEGDIQCEILEKQRDEANQRLSELEEVSNQLLKEMNVLEFQFQIERSCRESAEALAVKVTKENKVLKRKSQMLMPLIPELPENMAAAVTLNLESDPATVTLGDLVDPCDVVDGMNEEMLLLESQSKIAELQALVDGLLAERLQLEQQVEDLTKEQVQLREQLSLEVEEKEAMLRSLSKQSKTMNKIKRVSQLVTEEFTEISQKLELEQGLRQHAEVFAHQMLVQQTAAHRQSVMVMQGSETSLQLQQALDQIPNISKALCDIQRYYQEQSRSAMEGSSVTSEIQELRDQLEKSEEERKAVEARLCQANGTVTQLQEKVKQLQDTLQKEDNVTDEPEVKSTPPPPPPLPPPPPPPLPPPSTAINSLILLRSRRKNRAANADQNAPATDMKSRAVDEMMDRIKKGIVLRPTKKIQDDDSSWKDQRSENRKSAVMELKGMLDNIKRQPHRRVPSRRGLGRNVGEAELLQVLQRRRRAMGENRDPQDPQPAPQIAPAAGDVPWAGESSEVPVLRRLKQNREKRDSRIRASALMYIQEN